MQHNRATSGANFYDDLSPGDIIQSNRTKVMYYVLNYDKESDALKTYRCPNLTERPPPRTPWAANIQNDIYTFYPIQQRLISENFFTLKHKVSNEQ